MESEQKIQTDIMVALSQCGHKIFRANAGKVKTESGHWLNLFPKGFPDLCGWRKDDGKFIAIEVKNQKGRLSPEQKRFAAFASTQPILYSVCRSVQEALEVVNNECN